MAVRSCSIPCSSRWTEKSRYFVTFVYFSSKLMAAEGCGWQLMLFCHESSWVWWQSSWIRKPSHQSDITMVVSYWSACMAIASEVTSLFRCATAFVTMRNHLSLFILASWNLDVASSQDLPSVYGKLSLTTEPLSATELTAVRSFSMINICFCDK